MLCPTCSSPLPDGAMFCGQCGRAITNADVAAYEEARAAEAAAVAAESPAEPGDAPWVLQEPPAAAVPAGTPWWIDQRTEVDEPVVDEPVADEPVAHEPIGEETVATRPERDDDETDGIDDVVETPPAAPVAPPVRPEPSVPAAHLRAPGSVSTPGVRPSSAPLWTASIARIEAAADETPAPDFPAVPDEAPTPEEPPTPDVAPAPSEPAAASAGPDPVDAPRDGDTNVIAPLVQPSGVELGSRHRCSVCGATLTDEDIFCPECGTVVEAVAQSFTGPITPILTGPVATVPARATDDDDNASTPTENRPAQDPESVTDQGTSPQAPRPAPLAPTPVVAAEQTPPPFIPDPEPQPKKRRRLFGRRAEVEMPRPWSESAPAVAPTEGTPAPPMPSTDVNPVPPSAPESAAPRQPEVTVGEVPAAPETSPASPVEAPLAATPVSAPPQTAEPVLAPLPPAPVVDRPANPWRVNLGAPADDLENTRIVRPRVPGETFILQFSTGESFTVEGSGLVGRAPTPQPGESIDLLVRIFDPGRSVSKTHLEFGQEAGSLWVSDRWSGNGSIVKPPTGGARRAEPGKRVVVPRGSRVEIGEQFFIVS